MPVNRAAHWPFTSAAIAALRHLFGGQLLCHELNVTPEIVELVGVLAREAEAADGAVDALEACVHLGQLGARGIVVEL